MNKTNVSEPLNMSSMTVPKGSIPPSIVNRHAETATMRMHRCTRACANKRRDGHAHTRTPVPKAHPSARHTTSARATKQINKVQLRIMGRENAGI